MAVTAPVAYADKKRPGLTGPKTKLQEREMSFGSPLRTVLCETSGRYFAGQGGQQPRNACV
jgi:hypothetical protein